MVKTILMKEIINRSINYDESFMFNIQGDTWEELMRFIDLMNNVKYTAPCIVPVDTIDHDIIDFLVKKGISVNLVGQRGKASVVISRNPWEAFKRVGSGKEPCFILLLNDRRMKAEWYIAMKEFLTNEMLKCTVRIVFFSKQDDWRLKNIPFLNNKFALKIQSLTDRRIGLFGNMVWVEKENDFVMEIEKKRQGIEAMLARFKEGIDDLADLVNGMSKVTTKE